MSHPHATKATSPQSSTTLSSLDAHNSASAPSAGPTRPRGGPHADPQQPELVTFYLTAPFKPAAALVGDFNGWDPRAHPMETDGHGLFWVTVRLSGPTHYRFAVTVDGSGKQVVVADPYAQEVRWDAAGSKAFFADRAALCVARQRTLGRGVAQTRTP